MKILRDAIIVTFIVGGLIFARTGKDITKVEYKDFKVKNQHYWIKDHSDNDKGQLGLDNTTTLGVDSGEMSSLYWGFFNPTNDTHVGRYSFEEVQLVSL